MLAPDIVDAILDGRQSDGLGLPALLGAIPTDWAQQKAARRGPGPHAVEARAVLTGANGRCLPGGSTPDAPHGTGGRLVVPDNLTLLPLPPYAPELNAMENVWKYLRGNRLSHKVWNAYDAILDACCDAWNSLAEEPQRLTSITNRSWAKAVIE